MNIRKAFTLIKKDVSILPPKIPLKNYITYGKAGVCGACGACGACGVCSSPNSIEIKDLPKVKVKKL